MEGDLIKINKWLYPFSFLYGLGVNLRNQLFDWRILPSRSYDVPIICIGNITVGGTGKTPHTEYLIKLLQKDFQVAVLSRGYKRKTKNFVLATLETPMMNIGDEPYQMKQKFPHVHVAVDADRCNGVEQLCAPNISPEVDVVLLDDAYQHRKLRCGFYVLLTPYDRLYVHDHMLPWGRLRDLPSQSIRANVVVVTKCPDAMQPIDRRIVSNALAMPSYQQLCFAQIAYQTLDLPAKPLLLTGIANPLPILHHLQKQYPDTELMAFPDHHAFTEGDIKRILAKAADYACVVTTEKDYMRLLQTPIVEQLGDKLVIQGIQTDLGADKEAFDRAILLYVRENNRTTLNNTTPH
jgi:tetraacyldisaccharide 4'-kinase